MCRMQTPRHGLCRGGERNALPGTGDAGRLRRALPGLRPRLLRLFRPAGHPEHVLAREPAALPGDAAGRGAADLPHLQRRVGAVSAGVRAAREGLATNGFRRRTGDVMSHKLTDGGQVMHVGTLSRVEGEGAMHIEYSGGQATKVELRIYEPPRFYEAFLRGRAWTEPPDITARICGICPVAQER